MSEELAIAIDDVKQETEQPVQLEISESRTKTPSSVPESRVEDQVLASQQDINDCVEKMLTILTGNLQIEEQIPQSKESPLQEKPKRPRRSRRKHKRRQQADDTVLKFLDLYQVQHEIGHGKFGIVHLCVHKHSGKQYAVKDIRVGGHHRNKMEHLLIENEIRICNKLRHPNVVTLIENFVDNQVHHIVFDFISGGELRYDIVERTRYTERDACHCIEQILQGVAYLHKNEIIHRDLKPKNILLTNRRKDVIVKIADFGLAVDTEGKKKDRFGIVGTIVFSPPEVYRDDVYGTPVDIWACGVILYQMLFGRLPFDGRNTEVVYDQIDRGFNFPTKGQGAYVTCVYVKGLIRQMITKDQDARITAKDALRHPFLQNWRYVKSRFLRDPNAGSGEKFDGKRKFKSAGLAVMFATSLSRKIKLASSVKS